MIVPVEFLVPPLQVEAPAKVILESSTSVITTELKGVMSEGLK